MRQLRGEFPSENNFSTPDEQSPKSRRCLGGRRAIPMVQYDDDGNILNSSR